MSAETAFTIAGVLALVLALFSSAAASLAANWGRRLAEKTLVKSQLEARGSVGLNPIYREKQIARHAEAQLEPERRTPASITAIGDSLRWAEQIMPAIDERWPSR